MNEDSKVTVLCSNYNSSRWIGGYLESINNQFLKNFDIIFVDAKSTDNSLETIKNYKFREGIRAEIIECDSRVPVYTAWNMAIEKSRTPYVVNVNTDDRLYSAGLLMYLQYADRFPEADVIYAGYVMVADENHSDARGLSIPPPHNHQQLLHACYCGPFPLVKKKTLVEDGLFNPNYTISGDYEMWLRMSKKGRNFVNVAQPMGSYYWNPTGVSTNQEHFQEHVRQNEEFRSIHA